MQDYIENQLKESELRRKRGRIVEGKKGNNVRV